MRFDSRWLVAALALATLGLSPSVFPVRPPGSPGPWEFAAFDVVRQELKGAKSATVGTVCGPGTAPWADRGRSARGAGLRFYSIERQDKEWTKRFVETLLRRADWDSIQRGRIRSKPCDEENRVPWFVVTLPAGPDDLYALLDFESRWALLFRPNRPLGAVRFADRADTLFALVQAAMPSDPRVQGLISVPEVAAGAMVRPDGRDSVFVEELPEVESRVAPVYPEVARLKGVEGVVFVQTLVGADGEVKDAFARSSVVLLNDAALASVWQWRFKPARSEGKPIAVWVMVPMSFRLR